MPSTVFIARFRFRNFKNFVLMLVFSITPNKNIYIQFGVPVYVLYAAYIFPRDK